MEKFKGILYDFKWELIWAFKIRTSIFVYNPEESTNIICDLLLFRAFLEFLDSLMYDYIKYLDVKWEDLEIAEKLIDLFEKNIKSPKEFYLLNLNKKHENYTMEMIIEKVSSFINNYINGEVKVSIEHLEKNIDEN